MSRVKYKSQLRCKSLLTLFFDFYVMNEVWFRTLGAAHYGYPVTKILPHGKEEVINEVFMSKVAALKSQIVAALEASVRKEIRHWPNHTNHLRGAKLDSDGYEIDETSRYYTANRRLGLKRWPSQKSLKNLPLESIRELYFTRCWGDDYGGPKWGAATDFLIKLKASKSVKDDVFFIDRILDMQHNTGFILNKTVFATLDDRSRARRCNKKGRLYTIKPLTFRFVASMKEMVEHCSFTVKGIYTANLNYI